MNQIRNNTFLLRCPYCGGVYTPDGTHIIKKHEKELISDYIKMRGILEEYDKKNNDNLHLVFLSTITRTLRDELLKKEKAKIMYIIEPKLNI